jgi:hypothetical protein
MSNTPVSADLLQSLQIFTKFVIESIGEELRVLSIDNILLSVEEPVGNFVLSGVLDDGDDTFKFLSRKFTSPTSLEYDDLSMYGTVC